MDCPTCGAPMRRRTDKRNSWRCWKCHHFKKKYGMDSAPDQSGVCEICEEFTEHLVVDHDHVTGALRGRLCTGCNTAIGKLGDTPEGVMRAVRYLEAAQ